MSSSSNQFLPKRLRALPNRRPAPEIPDARYLSAPAVTLPAFSPLKDRTVMVVTTTPLRQGNSGTW